MGRDLPQLLGGLSVALLLSFFLIVHVSVGGVVLEYRTSEAGYYLLVRDPEKHWVEVSFFKYWLSMGTYVFHVALVFGGMAFGSVFAFLRFCRSKNHQQ